MCAEPGGDAASEMQRLRTQAWQTPGILTIKVDSVDDALLREILTRIGEGLYGPWAHAD